MIDIKKNLKSYKYAIKGLKHILLLENNARIHLAATIIVLALSAYFKIETNEWLWIALAITLVWITELLNTAIEKIVDFISPEYHPTAGKIKDLAAAAVLIAAIFALVIGVIIFKKHIF